MTNDPHRGAHRESTLGREAYFSEHYFSYPQLFSFVHQIKHIVEMRPSSAIEVGIGNGFVSTFLRRAGIEVLTADINPALEPDISAPLSDLPGLVSVRRDLVICCEVLEHMPLDELDNNLDHLRALGNRLFLTLPNSKRSWGAAGILHLPKLGFRIFDWNIDVPWRRPVEGGPHFWEVGYNPRCTRAAIIDRLKQRYIKVRSGRFAFNPYHIYFICE